MIILAYNQTGFNLGNWPCASRKEIKERKPGGIGGKETSLSAFPSSLKAKESLLDKIPDRTLGLTRGEFHTF